MLKTLDLHFPLSCVPLLTEQSSFNIIYPSTFPLAQKINLNTMMQAVFWDDYEFMEMVEESLDRNYKESNVRKYYDVAYLKQCQLRNISKREWDNNWGPSSASEWMEFNELPYNTAVTVVCYEAHDFNLKDLNRTYISSEKYATKQQSNTQQ